MKVKKLLAIALSLCMLYGEASYGVPFIKQSITAQADIYDVGCCTYNTQTGELILKGNIDGDTIRNFSLKNSVRSIKAEDGTVFPKDCSILFKNYSNCTSIDFSNVDTSNVTDMSGMFSECFGLTTIDLSGFDTSKVWSMHAMFFYCSNLTTIDVSSFDTRSVSHMDSMFNGCTKLLTIDLNGFDTSNVTNMSRMFWDCSSLSSIDFSKLDLSNVIYMSRLFCGCSSLTSLDLSNFEVSNVTDTKNMFADCSNLNTLTLGENFKSINKEASLPNGDGWVNVKSPSKVISGDGKYAVFENNGKNTYKLFETVTLTYPTNIKYDYNDKYHQLRFTWDDVVDADRYGIAVYYPGKWKIQTQNLIDTVYNTPKNLISGKTYKFAVAARVNGNWDIENAIKNAVTVTIPDYIDTDEDGYVDKFDPDPDNKLDYSFLDNEIYVIGMHGDDESYLPIEATSESSVKTSDTFEDEYDDEQYFRFKWYNNEDNESCHNGYKIYSVKYESDNKVLTINKSGNVVLEEDKDLPSQIWEVLPELDKYGNPTGEGLRFRSKMWYISDGKPKPCFISFDGSKLKVTNKDEKNKIKIFYPAEWMRFGGLYLSYLKWQNSYIIPEETINNYYDNVRKQIDPDENIKKYPNKDKEYDLLVNQSGGGFPVLYFHDSPMNEVGCEIIGTYNALVLHDEPVDFYKLAAEFEMNATSTIVGGYNGRWGSDPYKIGNCLDAYNVEYTTIDNKLNDTTIDIDDYSDVDSKNKATCDAFDTELKNGVCGIISYKWPTDGEGYLPFGKKLPKEKYLGIHTYATLYNSKETASPIMTFNNITNIVDYKKYLSTYDALKNYDDSGKLKYMDLYLVGYVLK